METIKDTIYREDAIEAVEELNAISFYELNEHSKEAFVEIRRALKALPSADRPQGEWKRRLVDNGFNADWICSECGYRVKTDFVSFNFCPNCGSKMRGEYDQ